METQLINNEMNGLARNINSLKIGGDNSSNNPDKVLFYRKKLY